MWEVGGRKGERAEVTNVRGEDGFGLNTLVDPHDFAVFCFRHLPSPLQAIHWQK